ncbi:MAG: Crp/Fnr family transcriptional regulator [Crocinitomicaceae bacterium]|jgi:CRP/FNR family transcriptional regulator|nr:Crp/Fnr family transcriptional regulator [Crocinitomicaceae bacterium]MCF8409751.1 Crp/Fnr family transcriptional regulator [Crocinitomicaceae bacterium]MCF8444868.1 Crp/Fnr family transcriptional regulator [Crocinitomicaceae bacterium]
MLNSTDKQKLIHDAIGYLLEPELIVEMGEVGRIRETTTDEIIMHVGDELKMIPIVLSGSIKVSRENDEGNELLLYYIEGGDTCAMTLQCCVHKIDSHIKATSMEPSLLMMFPVAKMEEWMDKYKSWREYILQNYHTRLTELMETIDAMAFMRLDERLLKYLTDQAKLLGTLELNHTHQQIADDLHSSRVVISRLLKQLENKGIIEIHRNKLILKNF